MRLVFWRTLPRGPPSQGPQRAQSCPGHRTDSHPAGCLAPSPSAPASLHASSSLTCRLPCLVARACPGRRSRSPPRSLVTPPRPPPRACRAEVTFLLVLGLRLAAVASRCACAAWSASSADDSSTMAAFVSAESAWARRAAVGIRAHGSIRVLRYHGDGVRWCAVGAGVIAALRLCHGQA